MNNHNDQPSRVGISMCPNGCVRMQFGMALVHMQQDQFRQFIQVANQVLGKVDQQQDSTETWFKENVLKNLKNSN